MAVTSGARKLNQCILFLPSKWGVEYADAYHGPAWQTNMLWLGLQYPSIEMKKQELPFCLKPCVTPMVGYWVISAVVLTKKKINL